LSGDNSYSGGTTIIGGTLTADHADSLGTGAVANSGVLQVGEGELEIRFPAAVRWSKPVPAS
ncbi:hypothetical protein EWU17_25690, partial [Salmonella enterica subsp. enterica serovar Heidelberg]|nr:hypothetical protein [Salmonella enterica subsp. enterica serovar Heidelberg]